VPKMLISADTPISRSVVIGKPQAPPPLPLNSDHYSVCVCVCVCVWRSVCFVCISVLNQQLFKGSASWDGKRWHVLLDSLVGSSAAGRFFFSSEAMVMGTRNVCSCCFVSSGRWGPRCKSGAGRNEATMQEEEIGGQRSKESRTLVCHGKAQSVLFVGIRYLPGLFHPGMPGSRLFLQVGSFGVCSEA
jgi:hypothetical protein